jgi:acetylornithine aminotransferase/acetylornithine/N-succinyldiaminopimelate aminotransferase
MAGTDREDRYSRITEDEVKSLEQRYLFATYQRYDLCASHGSGPFLFDLQGRMYLDFLAGIAVNLLGYDHPRINEVIRAEGSRLLHTSNLLYHRYQGRLAERLTGMSGLSRVFFTNSGTEAMEGALKIARAYARKNGRERKSRFLCVRNSFHGRSFGALSITSQEKYQAPFRPLLADVAVVADTTKESLERAFDDSVCALVLEPIQGEAGVRPLPADFLAAGRDLCSRHDALLILDEIQTGFGRTGKDFAFEHYGVTPDLMTVAKGIATGYPLGAVLGSARVADSLKTGEHGTTFGGGPLACRIALEVLDVIEEEGLVSRAAALGEALRSGLRDLQRRHSRIREVRGLGLMVGVEVGSIAPDVVKKLLKRGVIANAAHGEVLRLVPPLIIEEQHVRRFLEALDGALFETETSTGS